MKFLISLSAGPGQLVWWEGHADSPNQAEEIAMNAHPNRKIFQSSVLRRAVWSDDECGYWACGICEENVGHNPGYCSSCFRLLKGQKIWYWGKLVSLEELMR